MTYARDRYVQDVMSSLEQTRKTELKGIVTTHEVGRLCDKLRVILDGREITEEQRARLTRLTILQRRFTVGEANLIGAIFMMHLRLIKAKEVRRRMAEMKAGEK